MSTTGNLLGTAVSGLLTYQRSMATTGHNISNVNTPGYSRQRAEVSTRPPLGTTAGFVGNGVNMDTVRRSYDQFLTVQLRSTTAGSGDLTAYYEMARQIDNVVADPQAGLTPALQEFFHAVQSVSADPNSSSARQVLLSQATSLTNRFHYLDERLSNLQASVNTRIRNSTAQVNSLGQSIALLNQQIYEAQSHAGGQPPNDLLDQRDEAIRKLSELVAVSTVTQDDGMVNVFIGNGQTLVLAGDSATLSILQNEYDPESLDIGFSFAGGNVTNITDNLTGGELGGVLRFRSELLTTSAAELGRVAVGLSTAINAQHALGLDQNNALGGDFFTDQTTSAALASRNNNVATDVAYTVTVTNIAELEASDYRLDYNAGNYTVTRLSDNAVVYSGAAGAIDLTATEGFSLTPAGATINNGDSYLIKPVSNGASGFGFELTSTTQVAAAASLRTGMDISNLGNAKISQGSVSNTTNIPLGAAITLTYDPNALGAGIPGFTVTNGPGGTIAYDPATESSGKTFTFAAYGGFSFTISGTPQTGDVFTIANNTSGGGDNRNALALLDLQSSKTMINGASGPTASFETTYSLLVADVGARTRQAEIDQHAQQTLMQQANESWSNLSGVNLDEEAADLVKFQQAYQASAQVIAVAQSIFDTLIGAIRR